MGQPDSNNEKDGTSTLSIEYLSLIVVCVFGVVVTASMYVLYSQYSKKDKDDDIENNNGINDGYSDDRYEDTAEAKNDRDIDDEYYFSPKGSTVLQRMRDRDREFKISTSASYNFPNENSPHGYDMQSPNPRNSYSKGRGSRKNMPSGALGRRQDMVELEFDDIYKTDRSRQRAFRGFDDDDVMIWEDSPLKRDAPSGRTLSNLNNHHSNVIVREVGVVPQASKINDILRMKKARPSHSR